MLSSARPFSARVTAAAGSGDRPSAAAAGLRAHATISAMAVGDIQPKGSAEGSATVPSAAPPLSASDKRRKAKGCSGVANGRLCSRAAQVRGESALGMPLGLCRKKFFSRSAIAVQRIEGWGWSSGASGVEWFELPSPLP